MAAVAMDARQKKAFINIKYAAYSLIGGLENTMQDNEEGSPEYIYAQRMLGDHNQLVSDIYEMATTAVYREGMEYYNVSEVKDIRFCGREYLMDLVDKRVTKEGY